MPPSRSPSWSSCSLRSRATCRKLPSQASRFLTAYRLIDSGSHRLRRARFELRRRPRRGHGDLGGFRRRGIFSILIGVALSILLFVPRAARPRGHGLAVAPEGVVGERLPSDPKCSALLIYESRRRAVFWGRARNSKHQRLRGVEAPRRRRRHSRHPSCFA